MKQDTVVVLQLNILCLATGTARDSKSIVCKTLCVFSGTPSMQMYSLWRFVSCAVASRADSVGNRCVCLTDWMCIVKLSFKSPLLRQFFTLTWHMWTLCQFCKKTLSDRFSKFWFLKKILATFLYFKFAQSLEQLHTWWTDASWWLY